MIKSPASEFSHKAENHNDLGIVALQKEKTNPETVYCSDKCFYIRTFHVNK